MRMVHHRVGPPFQAQQHQRNDSKHKLQPLRAPFPCSQRLDSPLRRGATPEAPLPPQYIKVDERSGKREEHHGNSDGILMETAGGSVGACSGGKSSESDDNANTADGEDRGAGALQQGKDEAGPVHPTGCAGFWRH